jgi:ABC-type transporter Mla subunit MlaD
VAIETTAQGILGFLQGNDKLVQDVSGAAKDVGGVLVGLANRLDANRRDAADLVAKLGNVPFAVARTSDAKKQQERLLEQISEVSKDIQEFQDHPEITTHLFAQRSALYMALANTYNDSIATVVSFTPDEVDQLRTLLRRATLDAAARQRWADILDGAVQLAKLGLRLAAKLAA